MKKHRVIGIGEIVWDVFGSDMKKGGAPINFAYYCSQLGADAGIISAVGDDVPGHKVLRELSAIGLDTSRVQINGYPTGKVIVSIDGSGVPAYDIQTGVAWDNMIFSEKDGSEARRADVVCWGSLAQRNKVSRNFISEFIAGLNADCLKVFDINLRQNYYCGSVVEDSIMKADVLKMNEDELPVVAEICGLKGDPDTVIKTLIRDFDLKYVIYTCGDKFSEIFSDKGEKSHVDTPKIRVADTVGAGDSFTAAFVMGYLKKEPLSRIHMSAVKISSYVCSCAGAINPLPACWDIPDCGTRRNTRGL